MTAAKSEQTLAEHTDKLAWLLSVAPERLLACSDASLLYYCAPARASGVQSWFMRRGHEHTQRATQHRLSRSEQQDTTSGGVLRQEHGGFTRT